MKVLFVLAAALTFALGVAWLAFPTAMFAAAGVHTDAVGIYMARRYGALFFGYAVILWSARRAGPDGSVSAILSGGAAVTVVIATVSVAGAIQGVVGAAFWGAAAIEVTLAAAFIYYRLRSRPMPYSAQLGHISMNTGEQQDRRKNV